MGAHAERRPLRVLHAFATFVPAGPQLRTLDLIAGLGEEFEHEIIACDDELSARHSTPEGCRYACLPCPKGSGPLGNVRAWRKLLNERQPDLLLTLSTLSTLSLFLILIKLNCFEILELRDIHAN